MTAASPQRSLSPEPRRATDAPSAPDPRRTAPHGSPVPAPAAPATAAPPSAAPPSAGAPSELDPPAEAAPPLASARRRRALAALNWLCHAVLALGLTAPCMTFVTRMGGATEVARAAGVLPEPRSYSVLSGIFALVADGNAAVGVLLLTFSVLFPVAKLVVVRLTLRGAARGGAVPSRLLKATAMLGKYSMADVFVIALLVVASRTLPGGSKIELQAGTIAFASAALLSMYLTSAVSRAVQPPGHRPANQPY